MITTATSISKGLDYLGTFRARIGYVAMPTLLVYATGGFAYGGANNTISVGQVASTSIFSPSFGSFASSNFRGGWTVGGGAEWMFMPNWSAKIEYLYYDLGSVNSGIILGGVNQTVVGSPGLYAAGVATTASFNGQIVRVGLNYHFNWAPSPLITKF
ncbi:MAG: outer membrane beta-barrel protein [Methylocystis sp.]